MLQILQSQSQLPLLYSVFAPPLAKAGISTVPKAAREVDKEPAAKAGTEKEARAVPGSTVVDSALAYGPIT